MAPGMGSTHCLRLAGSFAGLEESRGAVSPTEPGQEGEAFGLLCCFKVLFVPRK